MQKSTIEEEFSKEIEVEIMAQLEQKRTLRDLDTSALTQQPLCIMYPKTICNFLFKTDIIHLQPIFHGFVDDDPHKHIKEFYVVYCYDIP